jgi:hypothetical protein
MPVLNESTLISRWIGAMATIQYSSFNIAGPVQQWGGTGGLLGSGKK